VNPPASVADWLSFWLIATLTVPLACAGVTACSWVELMYVTLTAATPPNVTVAERSNPEPVMVTFVPPAVGPEFGATPAIANWIADRPHALLLPLFAYAAPEHNKTMSAANKWRQCLPEIGLVLPIGVWPSCPYF